MKQRYGKKMLTVMVVGACLILGLCSLGLAQEMQVMKDASKMMSDAWKMFDDGQRMVIQGLEMNNQVAAKVGCADLMKPGNQTIGKGRDTVLEGAKLFSQGQKVVMDASDAKVMKEGMDMVRNGFKIIMDGKAMMEKGMSHERPGGPIQGHHEKVCRWQQDDERRHEHHGGCHQALHAGRKDVLGKQITLP